MRRIWLIAIAGLCSLTGLAAIPTHAAAQGGSTVYRDPGTGRLIYVAEFLSGRQPGEVRIGFTGQIYWFFNPLSPLEPAFGCAFATQGFPHLGFCQGQQVTGLLVQLGPGPNDVRVVQPFPALPGPNLIQGNKRADKIDAGPSDEQINGGKGNDVIDPGSGEDDVNAGPGNDEIDATDGERDEINGGKGKNDKATADKIDKVKNVEKVKRK